MSSDSKFIPINGGGALNSKLDSFVYLILKYCKYQIGSEIYIFGFVSAFAYYIFSVREN